MGTPGVPWVKNREVIVAALKKHQGKLTHACKDQTVDCSHGILKRYVDADPELKQLVSDLRNEWVETELDNSEKKISELKNHEERPDIALKAAMFFLNNLGKQRGYAHPEQIQSNENVSDLKSDDIAQK